MRRCRSATRPTVRRSPSSARRARNPLRAGAASISYELTAQSDVTLAIYDAQGRLVRTLVDGAKSVGRHDVTWDGRDGDGAKVAAGVYYYRMEAGSYRTGKSLVIVD